MVVGEGAVGMARTWTPGDFGEPALKIAGFQLWVHGTDSCGPDRWLRATVHCGASGASVWAQGSILQVADLTCFGEECARLSSGEAASATLEPVEPELSIKIETTDRLGHLRLRVEITPDHLNQSHSFQFEIDQSHLPGIIDACDRIGEEFQG